MSLSIAGNLTQRHRDIFYKNPLFVGMRLPEVRETEPLEKKFPRLSPLSLDLMKVSHTSLKKCSIIGLHNLEALKISIFLLGV